VIKYSKPFFTYFINPNSKVCNKNQFYLKKLLVLTNTVRKLNTDSSFITRADLSADQRKDVGDKLYKLLQGKCKEVGGFYH
jgi:hypothetical protein